MYCDFASVFPLPPIQFFLPQLPRVSMLFPSCIISTPPGSLLWAVSLYQTSPFPGSQTEFTSSRCIPSGSPRLIRAIVRWAFTMLFTCIISLNSHDPPLLSLFSLNCLFFFFFCYTFGMWDLSSPTRDGTQPPALEGRVLTTGPPGKSAIILIFRKKKTVSEKIQFSSVQSLSRVQLFATPWTAACQASLSITNFRSSLKLTSIESVMPSSRLILCRPLLLLPPILPSIRVFSNESTLRMRWPKYCRED